MPKKSNNWSAVVTASLGSMLLLSACGTVSPEGESAAYREGYFIGCTEGFEISGRYGDMVVARDEPRYQADAEYRRGWDEGYKICFDEGISQPVGEGGSTI